MGRIISFVKAVRDDREEGSPDAPNRLKSELHDFMARLGDFHRSVVFARKNELSEDAATQLILKKEAGELNEIQGRLGKKIDDHFANSFMGKLAAFDRVGLIVPNSLEAGRGSIAEILTGSRPRRGDSYDSETFELNDAGHWAEV